MAKTININETIHERFRRARAKERAKGSSPSTLSDPGFLEILLSMYEAQNGISEQG